MSAPEPFGRYSLLRRLAIGGMGELYLATRDGVAGFSKRLVVKRIRPDLAHDPEFVRMFLNEGRLAALLGHPNIVHIYELGQVDGAYFMAMEYVPGQHLGDVLVRLEGPLDLPYALHVMIQLCEGVEFAHGARDSEGRPMSLVHRDISPPNVLISYTGAVKLTDFGIAKVAQQTTHTAVGVLKGKFAYLSPEQAHGERIDRRSDIYALGLLLFEATVGKRANPGATEVEQLYAASQGEVLDPALELSGYPPELERIFRKATAVSLDQRYQSVGELHRELSMFQTRRRMIIPPNQLGELLQQLFPEQAGAEGLGAEPAAGPVSERLADTAERPAPLRDRGVDLDAPPVEEVSGHRTEPRRALRAEPPPAAAFDDSVDEERTVAFQPLPQTDPRERLPPEAAASQGRRSPRSAVQGPRDVGPPPHGRRVAGPTGAGDVPYSAEQDGFREEDDPFDEEETVVAAGGRDDPLALARAAAIPEAQATLPLRKPSPPDHWRVGQRSGAEPVGRQPDRAVPPKRASRRSHDAAAARATPDTRGGDRARPGTRGGDRARPRAASRGARPPQQPPRSEVSRLASRVWPDGEGRVTAGVVVSGEVSVRKPPGSSNRRENRAPAIIGLVLVVLIAAALGTCVVLWDADAGPIRPPTPPAPARSVGGRR